MSEATVQKRNVKQGFMLAAAAAMAMGWGMSAMAAGETAEEALTLSNSPKMLAAAAAPQEDGWTLVSRFGLWGMSIEGETGPSGHVSDIDMSFSDIMENSNFSLMPGVEVGKGRYVVVFNGLLAELENSQHIDTVLADGTPFSGGGTITATQGIADLAIGYRLWDIPVGDMTLTIAPAVGVRYSYMKVEIEPERHAGVDKSIDWVDPYIGARVNLQINENVAWRTDASIGGFGVGCDMTWSLQTMLDWRFAKQWELNVGYRALYQDYDNGDFEWDVTMHGPWIGISRHWM